MLKKLKLTVMGLITKGKITTGKGANVENAKAKEKTEAVKTSALKAPPTIFSPEEVQFIISKMRQADYKGVELETSFIIFSKLSALIKQ
jgi:hypothetical protein